MNTFKKIGVYFLLKYFLFYLIISLINQNFSVFRIDELKSFENVFFYTWILLFFPVISFLLFSIPIYYSFKLKSFYKYFFNSIFIILEFLVFVYFTSQKIEVNIDYVIFILIGVILFPILFSNFKSNKIIVNK